MKVSTEYIEFLKKEGLSTSEIRTMVDIKTNGITLTKAIYEFNRLYDNGEIDGFAESSINVLEKFYGKKLKSMKHETLFKKVVALQRCLVAEPDEESIKEAVESYLS